jgi:hypothetical protein
MIDIVIAFDKDDWGIESQSGLGLFYDSCAKQMQEFIISNHSYKLHMISGYDLNEVEIANILEKTISNHTFVAYSHGKNDALLYDNQQKEYISKTTKLPNIQGGLFYTWSCYAGIELGKDLVQNSYQTFIGYKDWIISVETMSDIAQRYIDCTNSGLKAFLSGQTALDAFKITYDMYSNHIDELENNFDFFLASHFSRNRNALVFYGDEKLVIQPIDSVLL